MAEIKGYKVVFEGEDWSIISDGSHHDSYVVSHVTCTAKNDDNMEDCNGSGQGGVLSWFRTEEDAICYYCGTSVPDGIQALVHLSGSF